MREALKVGISGVRGVVGQSFTPQLASSFAQAFGMYAGTGPVVVGRDTRTSGPMVEEAVVAGLLSVGCRPVLCGVLPTPSILFAVKHLGANGGIAITASHNEAPWNALKFAGRNGLFLSPSDADELFDIYHQQDFPLVPEGEIRRTERLDNAILPHLKCVLNYMKPEGIRKRRFPVAVDCCNGAGAHYSLPFLRDDLGCEVTAIHDSPSGRFERPPEPLPGHLERLSETVRRTGCVVGFAQDPDGDRLAIVDETGTPIGEDLTLVLCAQQVLSAHARGPLVVNQSASKAVDYVAGEFGVEVIRAKTGEIHVSSKMLEVGSVVGGESSGGVIVPAIHPCRDSFTAMALVLELLAAKGKPVSELCAALPSFVVMKKKFTIEPTQAPRILRAVRRHFDSERLELMDGVYVDFGDRWVHVRRSNTEPVVRLMAEAPTREQTEALVRDVEGVIREAM
jgi:phosphomannomutase